MQPIKGCELVMHCTGRGSMAWIDIVYCNSENVHTCVVTSAAEQGNASGGEAHHSWMLSKLSCILCLC